MGTTIEQKFDKKVRTNRKVYKSENLLILSHLELIKQKAKEANKGLEPYSPDFEKHYRCNTCGTRNMSHPVTSYCFICDTDNWNSGTH